MKADELSLKNVSFSLAGLLGDDYIEAVCRARAFLTGEDTASLLEIAREKVDFSPPDYLERMDRLVEYTGKKVVDGFSSSSEGAGTEAFARSVNRSMAPLSAYGVTRIGEDGKAYLIAKSEHYHAPLGHAFPGYRLIEQAKKLGIPNPTHNNTRGNITRLLETELVRVANGISRKDHETLQAVINSDDPDVLNRVINLETGSLAVEAALKMMLTRFFRLDSTYPAPEYEGRIPVFLVMADHGGGMEANYHGTTILAQILRGMWPGLLQKMEEKKLFRVVSLKINDQDYFDRTVREYDEGKYKVAGFLHEIILMNYGGIRLTKEYLHHAYSVCKERDIPILVDEIQSCIWSPDFFMFREYGLKPDFVSIGKGFPGGQYPASRILTTPRMDRLNLFGALVTNGQEELASLAYLITMAFAEVNREYIIALGNYYEERMRDLGEKFSHIIMRVEGARHMSTLFFYDAEDAVAFSSTISRQGIDISTQTYKANVPPSALTKIPLIATPAMVDFIIGKMTEMLKQFEKKTVRDIKS